MLKSKFRECGEVVFAEMRDKSTGIVRFTNERDAERAVSIHFHNLLVARSNILFLSFFSGLLVVFIFSKYTIS